jgi:hypothetical protein
MAAKVTSSGEYANNLLKLIFNATNYANMADNASSAPFTNLYVSLHTADPGASGTQTTSEAAYTSYARVAVARTSGGWVVTTNSVSPAATVIFPAATGGSETETFAGIGTSASGAGHLLYRGPITPNIAVSSGVTPELTTGSTVTET